MLFDSLDDVAGLGPQIIDGPGGYACLIFLLAVPALLIFAAWVSARFQKILTQHLQVPAQKGYTGLTAAKRLLEHAGLRGIRIMPTHGFWVTDHYDPRTREVVLSKGIYGGASLSAVGIAAHEVGHAIQHASGYLPLALRIALVPVFRLFFFLGVAGVSFGVVLEWPLLIWTGIGCLCTLGVLPILKLPIEFDASARARKLALEAGVIGPGEVAALERVLRAAALTYVARALVVAALLSAFVVALTMDRTILVWLLDEGMFGPGVSTLSMCVLLYVLSRKQEQQRQRAARAPSALEQHKLGDQLVEQGELAEAIAAYTKALEQPPHFVQAYANRAAVYLRTGQLDEALADVEKALRLAPDSADAYLLRGLVHFNRKELDAALADYDEAARRGKNAGLIHHHRGDVWLLKDDLVQAIECYTRALAEGAPRAATLGGRGTAYLFQGDYDRAVADLDEALALEPSDGIAYNNRGTALLRRGDYARAADDLRAALRLAPKHPNAYKNLAWLQATCPDPAFRDGTEALANASRALQLVGAQQPFPWPEIMAAAQAEAGNFYEALRWQEKCTTLDPAEQQQRLALYRARQPYRIGAMAVAEELVV
jgi:Zn-dependent membrane protease YugP/Flp pilus assembly protein TadD